MYDSGYNAAASPAYEMGLWVGYILGYLYFSFCLYKIAQNCGEKESAWWAFVPVVQLFLLLKVANKPLWWFLLFLIPLLNIIPFVIVWVHVARNCGLSAIWGVLAVLPILNLFALAKMALSKPKPSFFASPSQTTTQTRTPQGVG
jgi:hypothetical protein